MPERTASNPGAVNPTQAHATSTLLRLFACIVLCMLVAGCASNTASEQTSGVPASRGEREIELTVSSPTDTAITATSYPTPPAASPTVDIVATSVDTQAASSNAAVSLPLTTTDGTTPTVVLSSAFGITDSAHLTDIVLTILVNLNIREGPGTDQPIIGWLLAGAKPQVIGVSNDGTWLHIACPLGLNASACWVTDAPGFVQVERMASFKANPAVATPIPTTLPPPTPAPATKACEPSTPAGWDGQRIIAGDTLYDIAARTGVSVAELQAANCLDSDVILEGAILTAPDMPADSSVASGAGTEAADAHVDISGVPSIDSTGMPGNGECLTPTSPERNGVTTPTVIVGTSVREPKLDWEITEAVCIYVLGLPANAKTAIVFNPNVSSVLAPKLQKPRYEVWRILLAPGEKLRSHTVEVSVDGQLVEPPIHIDVNVASRPRIRVDPINPVKGTPVTIWVAGFPQGVNQLFFFQQHNTTEDQSYHAFAPISPRMVIANPRGEGTLTVSTNILNLGRHLVDTAANLGGSREQTIDPRVFIVN